MEAEATSLREYQEWRRHLFLSSEQSIRDIPLSKLTSPLDINSHYCFNKKLVLEDTISRLRLGFTYSLVLF